MGQDASVPISFAHSPKRFIPPEPQPTRWTVQIHRAGAWPGWRWLDALTGPNGPQWETGGPLGFVPAALLVLALPSMLVRRTLYALRGRTDWDVLVYSGVAADYSPRRAVVFENLPSRCEAERRAEELSAHLLAHDELPAVP